MLPLLPRGIFNIRLLTLFQVKTVIIKLHRNG